MSNMAIFADSTTPPEGRRAKLRQPLGSLAYLDIIPDNGGIILNLSEDGLAFQAVGPLHDQKLLQLVVQLPHSGTRIETAAEIMWLASSSRQAGVRFLDLPPDARLQIREWIESQTSPGAEALSPTDLQLAGATNSGAEADLPTAHEKVPSDSRQQKWLSLISEFEEKFEQQEEPSGLHEEKPESESECASPQADNTPAPPPKPEVLPWPSSARSLHEQTTRPAPVPSQEALASSPTAAESSRDLSIPQAGSNELGCKSEHPTTSTAKRREEPTLRRSDAERATTPNLHRVTPGNGPDFRLLRAAVVRSGPEEKSGDRPAKTSARKGDSLRNQVALVIVFALFSVLCFGIGTWVGNLPVGSADGRVSAGAANSGPTVPAPDIGPRASVGDGASPARNYAEKGRPRDRAPAAEKTRLRRSVISTPSTISPSPDQPATTPAVQSSASDLSTASPPDRTSSAQHVNTAPASDRTAQLSPANLSPQNPAPQVVDGYVLRPSDRFNPCHLTYRVDPVYPLQAQQQGIEGSVKIRLVIAADGSVQAEKLISGPPQLVSAALDAAKYWRYLPALLNGQAVPTEKDVEIAFRLPPH